MLKGWLCDICYTKSLNLQEIRFIPSLFACFRGFARFSHGFDRNWRGGMAPFAPDVRHHIRKLAIFENVERWHFKGPHFPFYIQWSANPLQQYPRESFRRA